MTRKREQQLQTVQRKMLRSILGNRRYVDRDGSVECDLDWIVRAADLVERARIHFQIPDWVEEVHRRKFAWAGHISRRHDGRWTRLVLQWSAEGRRKRGHPVTRWSDSLNKFFTQVHKDKTTVTDGNAFWMALAEDRNNWVSLTEDFVNFAMGR